MKINYTTKPMDWSKVPVTSIIPIAFRTSEDDEWDHDINEERVDFMRNVHGDEPDHEWLDLIKKLEYLDKETIKITWKENKPFTWYKIEPKS